MIPIWLMSLLAVIDLAVAVTCARQRAWWFVVCWTAAAVLTFSLIGMKMTGKVK